MQTPLEQLLSSDELAQMLGVKARSLEGWRRRGKGPRFIRLSGHKAVRYPLSAVRTWLRALERAPGARGRVMEGAR